MPWEKAYLQKNIYFFGGDKQFRSSHLDKNRNEKHKKKDHYLKMKLKQQTISKTKVQLNA